MNNVKEQLSQAYRVEQRINTKLEQISALRELAHGTAQIVTDMPGSPNRNISKLENCVAKMVDLQAEIYEDIQELLETKKKCMDIIKSVGDVTGQLVLEKRYLCYEKWEAIAVELGISTRQVYRVHDAAVRDLEENFSKINGMSG